MATTKKYVSLEKLGLYDEKIKGVISAGDTATLAAADAAAKAYADGLAENYDAAGAAATAEANANSYTDGKIATVDGVVAGVKATAEKGVADAATAQTAAEAAQGAADAAQEDVDALAEYVGTIPEGYTEASVVAYIDKKAAETLAAASGNSTETAASVKAQLDEYKTANDKAVAAAAGAAEAAQGAADDAQAAADAAQEDIDTFIEETYATDKADLVAEDERIAGLVAAEKERAEGVEDDFKGRIETMEAFWSAAQADGTDSNVIDTLKEIQEYIASDETGASEMAASIKQNSDAISAMDTAYKAADTALDERLDVLEAINHEAYIAADTTLKNELTAEINKKADQTALESAVQTLEGADTAINGRLDTLEAKFTGEDSVADQIAAAKQEAIDTAAGDATSKADTAESNAKAHADGLNTAMNTRVEALEAIDHEHANKELLDTYTQTEANLADAVTKKHEHSNFEVLEGITAAKVSAWDAAEQNAKTYADGLNTTMGGRVDALETWHANFVEVSEEDINALFA